ncbi:hypothetical protein [Mycobacterium sherrisii]|uniref:hypothetical protein n=1 Tax=Mycobacterium sherrisii TaxID=243061 RepID=UPI0012F4A17C|nr:hypothetical protein [Mycobacterium sherrisii]MCV7028252.1 hypothetical protein [Mycobacterium sherrisii]
MAVGLIQVLLAPARFASPWRRIAAAEEDIPPPTPGRRVPPPGTAPRQPAA